MAQIMSLLEKTKHLLRLYKVSPKKRLGQNFIVDGSLLQRLLSYASITSEDVILEIGAGLGFLTRLLSEKCKKVIAVEVDRNLVEVLEMELNDLKNVELIEGDILNVSVPCFNKVVSVPPYSISSPMLFWLLQRKFDCAVLLFQKEFAERLAASSAEGKDYGRLTVTAYYFTGTELLEQVPRKMFCPPPKVDSMVVRLKPRKPPFIVEDEEAFFELVRVMFTQRNKKVRNAIIPFLHKRKMAGRNAVKLADSLSFHNRRVWELTPEDFGALTNEVIQKTNEEALL
ncbi:MAG: 16S rRNA (adenine(1518)-N(6)/adenine(1519)-N(6))-dimethyltransferase RsmA [Candidatus Bathyarchaeota archaeon]|nr:16S rRNA (adenine(1518)-N(6)/adenine(1519)-N(6))-dimethyltransferase RsmA [Candidatus Bathyarchaeota archaeon]